MEDWYRTQDFFSEEQLLKIKVWTNEDLSNLLVNTSYNPQISLAAS